LLRGQGLPLNDDELCFQLLYLADAAGGYLEMKPLPLGRPEEPQQVRVRATAKAVDLIDGRIPADPGIAL
jgi:hypothetical protein